MVTKRWQLLLVAGLAIVGAIIAVIVASSMQDSKADSNSSTASAELLATIKASDYHSLVFNPVNKDTVFFGHHNGIMRSTDGGRTWQQVVDQPNFDAMSLVVHSQRPHVIYAAGHEVFMRSEDGGKTWRRVASNLPGLDIHAFAIHPEDPNRLYAFVVGYGLFLSKDGGSSWETLNTNVPEATLSLAVVPADSDILLLGSGDQGILRSDDGGQTWRPSGNILALKLEYVPASRTLYAATIKGIYRSADGGRSWSKVAMERPVMAITVNPDDPLELLAVTSEGQVYRVRDNVYAAQP